MNGSHPHSPLPSVWCRRTTTTRPRPSLTAGILPTAGSRRVVGLNGAATTPPGCGPHRWSGPANDVHAEPVAAGGGGLVAGAVDPGEVASSLVPLLVSQAVATRAHVMSRVETTRRVG
jgi:hypothetical protein